MLIPAASAASTTSMSRLEPPGWMIDVTPAMQAHRENLYTVSYREELTRFLSVVRGEQTQPEPREQIDIMRIVTTAYRSAEEKREVEVE